MNQIVNNSNASLILMPTMLLFFLSATTLLASSFRPLFSWVLCTESADSLKSTSSSEWVLWWSFQARFLLLVLIQVCTRPIRKTAILRLISISSAPVSLASSSLFFVYLWINFSLFFSPSWPLSGSLWAGHLSLYMICTQVGFLGLGWRGGLITGGRRLLKGQPVLFVSPLIIILYYQKKFDNDMGRFWLALLLSLLPVVVPCLVVPGEFVLYCRVLLHLFSVGSGLRLWVFWYTDMGCCVAYSVVHITFFVMNTLISRLVCCVAYSGIPITFCF